MVQLPARCRHERSGTVDLPPVASGFGYYVFPPISFSLQWDGRDVMWTWEGAGTWLPLKSAQFPNFRDLFDQVAPEEIREYGSPFLGALREPGLIQLWTGIVARTAPGWSLLVLAPANVPRSGSYELFEGPSRPMAGSAR